MDLDGSGNVQWTATLPATTETKLRCLGSGTIVLAGTSGGVGDGRAVRERRLYETDGSTQWTYKSSLTGVLRADVTNAVARCIGSVPGIVAFQVP